MLTFIKQNGVANPAFLLSWLPENIELPLFRYFVRTVHYPLLSHTLLLTSFLLFLVGFLLLLRCLLWTKVWARHFPDIISFNPYKLPCDGVRSIPILELRRTEGQKNWRIWLWFHSELQTQIWLISKLLLLAVSHAFCLRQLELSYGSRWNINNNKWANRWTHLSSNRSTSHLS